MHESFRQFPILIEALEVVSLFLDTADFEECVNEFLCQIAHNPLNKNSERHYHLRTFSSWTEEDHRFVKQVIAGIKQVHVVGGCEKKDFMQSDRKEKSIFVQEQWQKTLSGDTLFVMNIAKLIHEVAHLIAASLICYANSFPYTHKQNTPPKLGTKRKNPIQGDAGFFIEEFLFGGRIFPKDKKLTLEAEDYSSGLEKSYLISEEWIIMFANALRERNFERKNFMIPQTALEDLNVPSRHRLMQKTSKSSQRKHSGLGNSQKQSITDEEEEESESYKFAPNCLRSNSKPCIPISSSMILSV
jgi:hypothetical protein